MQLWRKILLGTYYHATLPYRAWRSRRASRAGKSPVVVLFYHRVADDGASPWTLSNQAFGRHMRWLKARFEMVSLGEAQRRIASGANHRPAVSISFDDGYAANCHEALPLLVSEKIPCTYFVSSRCVLEGIPFPHDVAHGYEGRPNSLEELRAMSAAGIEIGAHTRSHADLNRLKNPQRLHEEVVLSGEELQQAIGQPIHYFSFPFGMPANLNPDVFKLARDFGYEGVCSAYGGYNFPGDDSFHIQRICADELLRVKNWVTVDPRKTRRPYRFNYQAVVDGAREGAMIV